MVSKIQNYSMTTKPLIGSASYLTWSYSHLIKQAKDINEKDKGEWEKFDAQLCSLLWKSFGLE